MEQIKKIDIHTYATAFPQYAPVHPVNGGRMVSADEVIRFYDKLNVEKGVLLPVVNPEAQWLQIGVEETKWIADQHPGRFVWFCSIDPRSAQNSDKTNLSYLLEHYKQLGAKGVGEVAANLYADDPKMENLFAHCEKQKMPVILRISTSGGYGVIDEPGLPRLKKMLKKHPDLTVLVCGAQEDVLVLMRECSNLSCDFSTKSAAEAWMADRKYTAKVIHEFADRLFCGCAFSTDVDTYQFSFADFLEDMRKNREISEENYRKIVRENAKKLLGL